MVPVTLLQEECAFERINEQLIDALVSRTDADALGDSHTPPKSKWHGLKGNIEEHRSTLFSSVVSRL